jgi:hypothetical protein
MLAPLRCFICGTVHQRLDRRRIAHVAFDEADIALAIGGELLAARDIDIAGENHRAFAREQGSCRRADTRCRARHDDGLSRESHPYSLPEFLRVQLRAAAHRVNEFRLTLRKCRRLRLALHRRGESP